MNPPRYEFVIYYKLIFYLIELYPKNQYNEMRNRVKIIIKKIEYFGLIVLKFLNPYSTIELKYCC